MTSSVDTIIVGGGQAGLSVSYFLQKQNHSHFVLEQAALAGYAWRNQRWDSFTFVTPNWTIKLPGAEYDGNDPDGYLPRNEIVKYFENYILKYNLPVRFNEKVLSVQKQNGKFLITTNNNIYKSGNVVIATGSFQKPKFPKFSNNISSDILQLHSTEYRNPSQLPDGNVLVVGSAQSGCQITEDLRKAGRKVFLSTGKVGRLPRRWRDKDIMVWIDKIGMFDESVNGLPSPQAKFAPNPQLTGVDGGHTINLHQFVQDGVTLLGRLLDVENDKAIFDSDLIENLKKIDSFESEVIRFIDDIIDKSGENVPKETLPDLQDGYNSEIITELALKESNITTIIWACGFSFDYSIVKLPVFDEAGYPIHKNGITEIPGLYFVGLLWLSKAKSSLLYGVGEDAGFIAGLILNKR